jgi:hypothetical protein
MSLLKIEAFKMIFRTKEEADNFLRRLNLILSLYEREGEKGSYKYSIEDSNQNTPVEIGICNGHIG